MKNFGNVVKAIDNSKSSLAKSSAFQVLIYFCADY
jgi:hypothetical protein